MNWRDINTVLLLFCPQMLQESVSVFMFMLQIRDKEEAVSGLE